jgi:hypothetical protein
MAVVWPDGHGYYFLHGSEFDKRLYFQIINHDLLIRTSPPWTTPITGQSRCST